MTKRTERVRTNSEVDAQNIVVDRMLDAGFTVVVVTNSERVDGEWRIEVEVR